MADKPIVWIGSSLEDLREFPGAARQKAGLELFRVQRGFEPTDSKPMKNVGRGAREIRIHGGGQAHRVFYVANLKEAVYVLHAFEKKSRKTSRRDIELGQARYKQMIKLRRERDE